ncbi:GNAT family N-acetyltransferase [Moraxella nasicaprae]|uniref:GNAT family N-acetyltransferase n=1 Tax=Moraxella nasicaprae TaxID=2904122 RepID=A0ABY6F476_9GAMM|nr:GNAT family protein [Moraxella nasicaprae]UXZ04899.1 GNAT family N-acetyltransferase [Moraxella nasicaprae]
MAGNITTVNDTLNFINACIQADNDGKGLHYFIIQGNKIIGVVNIRDLTIDNGLIGCWIDETYQGKGITTKAVLQLIEIVKSNNLSQKLTLRAGCHHIGSNQVAIKCQFKFKETLLNAQNLYGTMIDLNIYELILG